MSEEKGYWCGVIEECDDFKQPIGKLFIDGETTDGPWAIMSATSFFAFGTGIGLGKGQVYAFEKETGMWKLIMGNE